MRLTSFQPGVLKMNPHVSIPITAYLLATSFEPLFVEPLSRSAFGRCPRSHGFVAFR